jgi:hypothetical protein
MQEYDEFMDDHMDATTDSIEDDSEELLEEDEISNREEAFMKGYEEAQDGESLEEEDEE